MQRNESKNQTLRKIFCLISDQKIKIHKINIKSDIDNNCDKVK